MKALKEMCDIMLEKRIIENFEITEFGEIIAYTEEGISLQKKDIQRIYNLTLGKKEKKNECV
ncbi:hypothetical protein [Fusobacterium necrophorum]|uniref:Uncharacterized protein n=2 Tax=Fusobacterium necrophorum TaxID=859 RepID=A0AAN3VXG5_9FUSO|nr:hypothetical protein [Fusobacterium necrophorum]AYV94736.1 hypothetical protein BWX37_03485 [Fusobacterium necrophorum subsp. funduliforme]EJU18759.1 hypothetical protein HMPREF1127_1034 [Fusobacterium necrophorum subsp. funduliforme Fnf 1007]KYL02981.1 hypothetical protein A2J06_09990 [Fusobacterium necrophorum subsp. funduliforme]KYM37715.1 hypothetical protein A2U03_10885 [Fusobacterium necrophorum subsp. funduliforme]KYM52226.1 hypothetical protein A2U04_10425 [Fusobacterium necrophorum